MEKSQTALDIKLWYGNYYFLLLKMFHKVISYVSSYSSHVCTSFINLFMLTSYFSLLVFWRQICLLTSSFVIFTFQLFHPAQKNIISQPFIAHVIFQPFSSLFTFFLIFSHRYGILKRLTFWIAWRCNPHSSWYFSWNCSALNWALEIEPCKMILACYNMLLMF